MTYMNCVVLLKLRALFSLAHEDEYTGSATEYSVARTLVGLPCRNEVAEALLEQLTVNLDLCHDDVELQQWQRKKLKID